MNVSLQVRQTWRWGVEGVEVAEMVEEASVGVAKLRLGLGAEPRLILG